MRLLTLFALMISTTTSANVDWRIEAQHIFHDDEKADLAKERLLTLKDLDNELSKAMKKEGPDENLALAVIRELPRLSMVDDLISALRPMNLLENRAENYVVTLSSMVNTSKGKLILKELAKKVEITDIKTSAVLRASYLDALIAKDQLPDTETLLKLLEDPSYDIRLKIGEAIDSKIKDQVMKYGPVVRKGLSTKPFPVRLKMVNIISKLKTEDRLSFKDDIQRCQRQDENAMVKEACLTIKY